MHYYRRVYSNIPPPPPLFNILSLSMTTWRGMWHIWYIHIATAVYSCTLSNTMHILVNYAHNYVSRLSMRIITLSVLLHEHISSILI